MRLSHRLMIGFIWLVVAIDIYCCQWLTLDQELNPIAREIMARFGVWGLVSAKVVSAFIVTEWLRFLPRYYTVIMCSFMVLLLLILTEVI